MDHEATPFAKPPGTDDVISQVYEQTGKTEHRRSSGYLCPYGTTLTYRKRSPPALRRRCAAVPRSPLSAAALLSLLAFSMSVNMT